MIHVSVIIPIHNGERWINNCMNSIAAQNVLNFDTKLEIVVYDDGSTDRTKQLLQTWGDYFHSRKISFIITGLPVCKGVGAAKNGAVRKSSGDFLCFQDVDDTMRFDRISLQHEAAQKNLNALVGSQIQRVPPGATPRLVHWANNLKQHQLKLQIYTSNGPTLLMPTWFCHRSVYEKVGGFVETGYGTPEDLIFFYAHLDRGGDLLKMNEELVNYTYHENATTFSISRESIWKIQLARLERCVLPNWENFTIWNAGKAGRKLVRALHDKNIKKVKAFCDVDIKKIGRTIELYSPINRKVLVKVPVIHFSEAQPPLLVCMKFDLSNGQFEENLKTLNLEEGKDYFVFN